MASVSRYRVTVTSSPVSPVVKEGRKVKAVSLTEGVGRAWNWSPLRAEASTRAPSVRGCPPTVSIPAPISGRVFSVMAASALPPLPPETGKSSAEKEMTCPTMPFLEKSETLGTSVFLFQKKAEAGRDRVQTSANASTGASILRKAGE